MSDIKLFGRLILEMNITAITGLHIGGSSADLEIGGVDNPVIRDLITQKPYIPGSSLKGKVRSQLEKALGSNQNTGVGQARIHTCKSKKEYDDCDICQIFGAPGESEAAFPTRLIVRDIQMTEQSAAKLKKANTDMAFTELKTEVAIDRVTSAASPRNIERVPAGTIFGPAEIIFSLFDKKDKMLFKRFLEGLLLVEDDYLGGSGSRGSGKIVFEKIKLIARRTKEYSEQIELGNFTSIQELTEQIDSIDFSSLYEG